MRQNLPVHLWHKSSYSSGGTGNCLETQLTADGLVAVGDSKDRTRGAFTFSPAEWAAFVDLIKQDD